MAGKDRYLDKIVVITGASSGFGKGTALELAKRGAQVALAARGEATLKEIAHACELVGGEAIAIPTDVSDMSAVHDLAERTINHFGHFDVWINDAGVGAIGRFDVIPLRDHEQLIRTDLLGTIAGSHCALKHFGNVDREF